MVGKITGYLVVGVICMTLAAVMGVVMFVDLDRPWTTTRLWMDEHVPFLSRQGERSEPGGGLRRSDYAWLFADAAFRAVKSGKARPGDLLDLGRMFYRARSDGHLDAEEFGRLVDLAHQTGIIDEFLNDLSSSTTAISGTMKDANGIVSGESGTNPISQLQRLLVDFEQARADGRIDTQEILSLVEAARASEFEERLAAMLPDGYDQTAARQLAQDLVSAAASGRVSVSQMSPLIQMFTQAQADQQLDQQEVDRLMQTAKALIR